MISGNINSTYFSVYTYSGEMIIISASEPFYVSWTPSDATGNIYYDPYSQESLNNYSGYISFSNESGVSPKVGFFGCTFLSVETNVTETYRVPISSGSDVPMRGMFQQCMSLQYANLSECRSLGDDTFNQCINLTSVSLPLCQYVSLGAFFRLPLLRSISLPMCSYIGEQAFMSCSSLSQVYLPVCEYIGMWAFDLCTSLLSISLPLCSYISAAAFQRCSSLSYVNLSNCTYIAADAFCSCRNLNTFIIITSDCILNSRVFQDTPIESGQGRIYVPSSFVSLYRTASGWSEFSSKIYPIA